MRRLDGLRYVLPLICDDQPGAAVATIYAQLRRKPRLSARRAVKRVNVSALCLMPKMIFDQHLHTDLAFDHAGIIKHKARGQKSEVGSRRSEVRGQKSEVGSQRSAIIGQSRKPDASNENTGI